MCLLGHDCQRTGPAAQIQDADARSGHAVEHVPEPEATRQSRTVRVLAVVGLALGGFMTMSGVSREMAFPLLLGPPGGPAADLGALEDLIARVAAQSRFRRPTIIGRT